MNNKKNERESQAEICIYCGEEWPYRLPKLNGEGVCYICRMIHLNQEFKEAGWPETALEIVPTIDGIPVHKIPDMSKEQI